MKNFKYISLSILIVLGISSCDYDSFEEEDALSELEAVNQFVRFSTEALKVRSRSRSQVILWWLLHRIKLLQ